MGRSANGDLGAALRRYEHELQVAGLADATVDAYVYRARRFVEWLRTEHGARSSTGDDQAALAAYEKFLRSAYESRVTQDTFLDGARRFVNWLTGDYVPGGDRRARSENLVPSPRAWTAPVVDLKGLEAARRRYREIEPRDLFYRAAVDLLGRAWDGSEAPLTVGEALAVLLFTWNQAFYRYHAAAKDHVDQVERLVARHRPAIAAWRAVRLAPGAIGDPGRVEVTFGEFEGLLGPVGAAKGLHLLAPTFFPIWDRKIAAAYRCSLGARGTNADRYLRFIGHVAGQCFAIDASGHGPADVVKALDEWNYVQFTRGE